MPWVGSYEELREYLRQFVNITGSPAEYDFVGSVHLLLACLDNLRQNALEAELEDLGEFLADEQAAFLLSLAELVRRRSSA